MFDFIDKLRKKPERTKRQIAFFTSFLFSLSIFVVWATVIYPDFNSPKTEEVANTANAGSGPIESLTEIFSKGFESTKNSINQFKEVMSGIASSTEVYSTTTTSASTTSNFETNSEPGYKENSN